MPTSSANIATQNASRYLQQLCKHWGHKFAVQFTPTAGDIMFDDARKLHLEASADSLVLHLTTADQESLARMEMVVEEHIVRFAFREQLVFEWHNEGSGG